MSPPPVSESLQRDVRAVASLSSIPTILAAMREVTGLRFGVIARVTPREWVACAVYDELEFGLRPGDPLEISNTFCSRVNATNEPVVMNDATTSEKYRTSHVPKLFGFRAYISVPIFLANGTSYGTVCALDPNPGDVDNAKVISTLSLFGQLISQQLEASDREFALNRTRQALQLRVTQLTTFAAVASHDLRSPLRGIGNLATWLDEELTTRGNDAAREYVGQISRSVRRMGSLVDGMLQYASAGEEAELQTPIGLAGIIDAVVELYAPLNSHITAQGAELTVKTRRQPLQHVLANLVDNAIKHAGGAAARIRIAFEWVDHALRCTVSDDGPGIAVEHHERVWRLFQSLEVQDPERVSGVGLAIVKKLVENEGGRVWLDSQPGTGARFVFTWPAELVTPVSVVNLP